MTKKRLILAMMAVAIAVGVKKAKSSRESDWHGLTESEVRSRLDAKLPGRLPDEKRSAVSDRIVAQMRDRGVISGDPVVTDE